MADGLRGAQDNDQVRLDQRGVDASVTGNGNKPFVLRVVNEDGAAEGAGLRWRQQTFEIALTQLPAEPAGDENRLSLVPHADQLERSHRCCERLLTWILLSAGQRQGQRLDEDRRSPAPRRDRLERRPGERKPQRVTNCRASIGYPRRRRRGAENHVVVRGRDHDDARPREQRNTTHDGNPSRPSPASNDVRRVETCPRP